MSNRSEILAIVKTRIEGIRIADGFATDAGATVFMGEAVSLGPDDPDTAVAIIIGDDEPHWQGVQLMIRLPFHLAALAKGTLDEHWTTIEAMLGDIKQAMEVEDRRMGRRLTSPLTRGSTRTMAREAGSTTVGVTVTYVIDYAEVWGAP